MTRHRSIQKHYGPGRNRWLVLFLVIHIRWISMTLMALIFTGESTCSSSSSSSSATTTFVPISHAFTISSWIRPLLQKLPFQRMPFHSEKLSPNLERIVNLSEEENVGTMDTETRRMRRLDRLTRPSRSSSVWNTLEVQFLKPQPQVDDSVGNNVPPPPPPPVKNPLGEKYMVDLYQHNSIISDAPAILLQSGAGTGKTTVLAGRIAYLLRTKQVEPKNMIILSFTRRDAEALKEKAMEILFHEHDSGSGSGTVECTNPFDPVSLTRESLNKQLWCGTIHSFAVNILRKYNPNDMPLRIISSKEMKTRVRNCLGRITTSDRDRMMLYRVAMEQSKQSIGTLVHYIVRCIELWKEAGVLSTPYSFVIQNLANEQHEKPSQDDYVELAMRLGIPQEVALLALDIAGDYQEMHAGSGTADPSDVAQMAHDFLVTHPSALHSVRSKLKQIILDEYQDVSVSQHKLIRMIVRGADEANQSHLKNTTKDIKLPVLIEHKPVSAGKVNKNMCFHVPKIICAGDANQSIYGWRGAAPSLTVEGFREDFPQGLVVPLGTNYRLSKQILNAANVLLGHENMESTDHSMLVPPKSYDVSPAAVASISKAVQTPPTHMHVKEALSGKDENVYGGVSGKQLLLDEALISESRSSVFIQGLWDQREEAKFIAAGIRKRNRERHEIFTKVHQRFNEAKVKETDGGPNTIFYDSTDVAIMVRSRGQLKLIEEALINHRIPYTIPHDYDSDASDFTSLNSMAKIRNPKFLPMKAVKLITMHMAKGDEFDDVYLAGWSEGVFPHPSSLSTNRLYEERRIAYVALTRARQRVVITYSFMKRVAYFGSNGMKKDVTEPVEPSRFLYDLMDISQITQPNEKKVIEWSESYGFKEIVAGTNLPAHYANSYKIPSGFTKNRSPNKLPISTDNAIVKNTIPESQNLSAANDTEVVINEVQSGLEAIFSQKRGARGKYKTIFRSALKRLGIVRGSAVILTMEGNKKFSKKSSDVLITAPGSFTTTRPLSRCTAEQLGLYLFYLLHKKE